MLMAGTKLLPHPPGRAMCSSLGSRMRCEEVAQIHDCIIRAAYADPIIPQFSVSPPGGGAGFPEGDDHTYSASDIVQLVHDLCKLRDDAANKEPPESHGFATSTETKTACAKIFTSVVILVLLVSAALWCNGVKYSDAWTSIIPMALVIPCGGAPRFGPARAIKLMRHSPEIGAPRLVAPGTPANWQPPRALLNKGSPDLVTPGTPAYPQPSRALINVGEPSTAAGSRQGQLDPVEADGHPPACR